MLDGDKWHLSVLSAQLLCVSKVYCTELLYVLQADNHHSALIYSLLSTNPKPLAQFILTDLACGRLWQWAELNSFWTFEMRQAGAAEFDNLFRGCLSIRP
jgi:hypothetical protein